MVTQCDVRSLHLLVAGSVGCVNRWMGKLQSLRHHFQEEHLLRRISWNTFSGHNSLVGMATDHGPDYKWIEGRFPVEQRCYSIFGSVHICSGFQLACYRKDTGGFSKGVIRPKRYAGVSSSSRADLKKGIATSVLSTHLHVASRN
jgi:hypothetical protein